MSNITTIDVYYYSTRKYSVAEILEMYLTNGWNLNDFGHISLRPLGDKDDFDWVTLELDQKDELYRILLKKFELGEDPAVILMWNETHTGAVTTFFPLEHKISFLLNINRQEHPDLPNWTDISWYLPLIIKPLLENNVNVPKLEFLEML
jgi:hypothetical protein